MLIGGIEAGGSPRSAILVPEHQGATFPLGCGFSCGGLSGFWTGIPRTAGKHAERARSLNLSTAVAVVLYEGLRQTGI